MTETTTVEPDTTDAPEVEPVDDADTFGREYVEQLRDENKQRRTEAKSATERGDALYEQLLTRTIEQATDGILFDPTDLPRQGDYDGDDGTPDIDKIRAAAEELAERKPYLSRARGDVSQGARRDVRPETLGEILRQGWA